jgi:hypothetical protein
MNFKIIKETIFLQPDQKDILILKPQPLNYNFLMTLIFPKLTNNFFSMPIISKMIFTSLKENICLVDSTLLRYQNFLYE